MIRVRQIKVSIYDNNIKEIKKKTAKKLKIDENKINDIKIIKESIDARDKNNIYYIYEVEISIPNEKTVMKLKDVYKANDNDYNPEITGKEKLNNRPIIVGSGPAGLFCGYMLSKYGYKPIIIERGEKIEDREKTVEEFLNSGKLNINSNVQFGEGGAGTFSDGKLNTLIKDKNGIMKKVFDIFVENGAPSEILYKNKPHIGTDMLKKVIINIRNNILKMGGEIRYNSCLTDLIIKDGILKSIEINNSELLDTDLLVLAIGHSARDTFKMLNIRNLNMDSKPFAVGIRIQHKQDMINKSQYGEKNSKYLDPADYKLTYLSKNNKGVYSFCMCPGGYVINASSEEKHLAINGMSYHSRNSENSNSAIVVQVTKKDFGDGLFDGVKFQRNLESKAYEMGNGNIPVQLLKDFKENRVSTGFQNIKPVFKGKYTLSNINDIFPKYICEDLKEAIDAFGRKIKGFNSDDSILSAVESRTSSPVKIIRNENLESNIKGIYPCGEGAGYAGGITTSAIDGIKVFEKIIQKYIN